MDYKSDVKSHNKETLKYMNKNVDITEKLRAALNGELCYTCEGFVNECKLTGFHTDLNENTKHALCVERCEYCDLPHHVKCLRSCYGHILCEKCGPELVPDFSSEKFWDFQYE